MRLNFSMFTNFTHCPLRVLLLKTNVVEKQPLFREQAVGLYAHAYLQDAIAQEYGKDPIDHWGFLEEERELLFEKDEYKRFILENFGEMISGAKADVLSILKEDGVIDVEIEKEIKTAEKGFTIHGRCDIIGYLPSGEVIIYDLKRSNSNKYDDKQLSLYAYLLRRNGFKVKSIKFIFIRYAVLVKEMEVNDVAISHVLSTLYDIADAFRRRRYEFFKANPTTRTCAPDRCAAFSVCPYGALKDIYTDPEEPYEETAIEEETTIEEETRDEGHSDYTNGGVLEEREPEYIP